MDIFDARTGRWTSTGSLSVARELLSAAATGTVVVFAGGRYVPSFFIEPPPTLTRARYGTTPTDAADVYDAKTGAWSRSSLSDRRYLLTGVASSAGLLFFAGGGCEKKATRFTEDVDNSDRKS